MAISTKTSTAFKDDDFLLIPTSDFVSALSILSSTSPWFANTLAQIALRKKPYAKTPTSQRRMLASVLQKTESLLSKYDYLLTTS